MNRLRATAWLREGVRVIALHRRSYLAEPKRQPASGVKALPRIVVTLSTLPGRIDKIFPALNSLLDQTLMPERIILAIPEYSRREQKAYMIPDALLNHPVVSILPSDRDWGPATKLIPTLRHYSDAPDTLILAVDDDNIYPRTYLETFARFSLSHPDAALSLRGWHVPPSRYWNDVREFKGTSISSPVETDVIQGCGGILVRPGFFDEEFFDYTPAPQEAFFVDDVWISGHLARRGIRRLVLPYRGAFVYFPTRATFSGVALDRNENIAGMNDEVMINYFDAYWRRA